MKASPKSFPEGKDLKNARCRSGGIQDIGKKIDVNAFAMELFKTKIRFATKIFKIKDK